MSVARQHLHVVGKTGVGKSMLLRNMILGDVKAGRGTVVIDPRGDLVADIRTAVPLRWRALDHLNPHTGEFTISWSAAGN